MSQTVSNVKIEPMTVTWGEDVAQVQTITCVPDSSDSLDGKYFLVYTALNGTKYHVWFNTSGGSATDPAPGGSTAQTVAITTGDSAATIATAVASALDGLAGFVATANGAVVTCTNAAVGYSTFAHDGNSGFSFGVTTQGNSAADVGICDGDIEVSTKENLVDIKSHQSGTNVLSQIRSGKEVEISLNLKETSVAQLRKVFTHGSGQAITPAAGTEVFGMGTGNDFTQTLLQAAKLNLHPVVLGSSDHSRDMTFWKAYPMFDKLNFSGEKEMVIQLKFKIYPDTSKNARIRYFAYADGTQTLT